MNILLVGCGKMGAAMVTRWQNLQLSEKIWVVDPHATDVAGVSRAETLDGVPAGFVPDVVIFAVKPQILDDVLPLYTRYAAQTLFISIAAGKTLAVFENALGASAAIVRAMPNTPAAIGLGMTVAVANANVSPPEKAMAASLLGAVGEFIWADDEGQMNAVTALSGSGPAYVFLLIEAMAAAGVKAGLPEDMAQKLARQTVIGSAALAADSNQTPASVLRENVTSPNGTTAAALAVLMADDGLQPLLDRAIAAAAKRAEELS